jgi:ketosteroid isomerase-like protein
MREQLEQVFADWATGDWTTTPRLLAPDVRFSGAQPEGQVEATGPEGVAQFMRGFLAGWERYTTEIHDLEDLGDGQYLATGTQFGKGAVGGVDITAPVHIALSTRDGRITQMEWWLERERALEALGRR